MTDSICHIMLADSQLIEIVTLLGSFRDVVSIARVSKQWYRVCRDESVWKKLFFRDFPPRFVLGNAPTSWYERYKYLCAGSPKVLDQTITAHTDEVLYVAVSHNGALFSSCSKDCAIKVFTADRPCQLKYERSMKDDFHWLYTQKCEFNQDDTLLLVSGIKSGDNFRTSSLGDVVIFQLGPDELIYRCRASNRPYDFFGCWFNQSWFLTSECEFLGETTSFSTISLCKSSQDVHSERQRITMKLFRFINFNASTIRMINVGTFVSNWLRRAVEYIVSNQVGKLATELTESQVPKLHPLPDDDEDSSLGQDRLLIFACGSVVFVPHQVGFKVVKWSRLEAKLTEEVMSQSRLNRVMEKLKQLKDTPPEVPDVSNAELRAEQASVLTRKDLEAFYDFPDYILDMKGHIIGMALSPDHKLLYANVRSWVDQRLSSFPNVFLAPPISQNIEIRVVDLTKLTWNKNVIFSGHSGFTTPSECFFIFLDAGTDLVASGSEDKCVHIWDQKFGKPIAKLPHEGVVNSVAFSPNFKVSTLEGEENEDNNKCDIDVNIERQFMVTASDDKTLKIWRSKSALKMLDQKL